MISAQTIASLEERGLEYILGVRERSSKEVQAVVLNDPAPSVSLVIPRRGRRDTELEAKEVRVGGRRYIVCRNLAEAKRDAEVREAVLRHLRSALRGGDKALVGNSAYRRYLKTPDEKHFEIDDNRVIEDARYDGLYVLRTNTTLNALAVMLRYRELLRVEDICLFDVRSGFGGLGRSRKSHLTWHISPASSSCSTGGYWSYIGRESLHASVMQKGPSLNIHTVKCYSDIIPVKWRRIRISYTRLSGHQNLPSTKFELTTFVRCQQRISSSLSRHHRSTP